MTPTTSLRTCILRTTAAKDGRGQAQAERLCRAELGGSPNDRRAAAAARRLGEWLRTR